MEICVKIFLENAQNYISPVKNELVNFDEGNEFFAELRHFRNSLCHMDFEKNIDASEDGQIHNITFKDYNKRQRLVFKCEMSVSNLENFFRYIAGKILEYDYY